MFEKNECEFVAVCEFVEVKLNPIPLIIYAVYMRIFDNDIAMKHVKNVERLSEEFSEHRIMVLGDFHMNSVR